MTPEKSVIRSGVWSCIETWKCDHILLPCSDTTNGTLPDLCGKYIEYRGQIVNRPPQQEPHSEHSPASWLSAQHSTEPRLVLSREILQISSRNGAILYGTWLRRTLDRINRKIRTKSGNFERWYYRKYKTRKFKSGSIAFFVKPFINTPCNWICHSKDNTQR